MKKIMLRVTALFQKIVFPMIVVFLMTVPPV